MSWADELTPEERERFDKWRSKQHTRHNVGYDALAEFASYYGWGGVSAVLTDEIDAGTFVGLLKAGRKRQRNRDADRLIDMYNAVGAVLGGRKAVNGFKRTVKERRNG